MYLSETYHSYPLPGPHDMMTLQVCGFKGEGRGQHFQKMYFSGGDMPVDYSVSKTI